MRRDVSSDTYDIDESGIVPMNLSPSEPRPRESTRSGMSVGSILKTLRPADVLIEKADSTHKNPPSMKDDTTSEGGDLLSVVSCDKSILSYGGSRMVTSFRIWHSHIVNTPSFQPRRKSSTCCDINLSKWRFSFFVLRDTEKWWCFPKPTQRGIFLSSGNQYD